jgi:putative phage-type endonuclease
MDKQIKSEDNLSKLLTKIQKEECIYPEINTKNISEFYISLLKNKFDDNELIPLLDVIKKYLNINIDILKHNVKFDNHKFILEQILCSDYVYKKSVYKKSIYKKRDKQFNFLKTIPQFEQRSKEWFDQREGMITASDIGTALDMNHHQQRYTLILKKCDRGPPYQENKFVHHGKKYEEIATMIFQFRYNTKVEEFGLLPHSLISFLGASPDGICTRYTLTNELSKLIGRMLEIKCPLTRTIRLDGKIFGEICPKYYWAQVQIQLEVCDLDECDFWQCRIEEYASREEFINDTNYNNMYLSNEHNMEKGCIIQLMPKDKINEDMPRYEKEWYSKYIYPPKINMSPKDCDEWILENINNIWKTHPNCIFDKVIYWKLTRYNNVTIMRDREWFNKVLPQLKETWDLIKFYRKNEDKLDELCEFIDKLKGKRNKNDIIMDFAVKQLNGESTENIIVKPEKVDVDLIGAFVSDSESEESDNNKKGEIIENKNGKFYKSNKNEISLFLSDSEE